MTGNGERPWIAYVGPFHYPDGGAAARRVLGMAESFSLAGFDVVVASGAGDSEDAADTLVLQGPGISYCLLPERMAEHWPRPLRRFRYAWMGARTVAWLASRPTPPAAVVLYSGYTPYLQRLLPWCRRNRVRLLFDAVEWYEPEHASGYLTSPYQWNIEWAMRRLLPRADGVIAISKYLADYYRGRGVPVTIVPPTTSAIAAGEWQPDDTLRLCYAGSPGSHKDDLGTVLQAVALLADEGAAVRLDVAGPEPAHVAALLGLDACAGVPWLHVHGMLPQAAVAQLVGKADFTVLVREDRRQSNAGFPTKFVESFAAGTPVIANLTSDIGDHLRDRETGLVCGSNEVASVAATLRRALALDQETKRSMRESCSQHALLAFNSVSYAPALQALLAYPLAEDRSSERSGKGA
jgi:glycosyltransferase involved in cell wall biosynthesis